MLFPLGNFAVSAQWRDVEPEARRLVAAVRADPRYADSCTTPPEPLEIELLGRVHEVCVSGEAVVFEGPDGRSLHYQPDPEALPTSICVRRLDSSWIEARSATSNCPTGFAFEPGV